MVGLSNGVYEPLKVFGRQLKLIDWEQGTAPLAIAATVWDDLARMNSTWDSGPWAFGIYIYIYIYTVFTC